MASDKSGNRWIYPKARQDESVVEELTEEKIKIADPYRYLEDPDCEETAAFVDSQNKITRPYLDAIPERGKFHARYVIYTSHGSAYMYEAMPTAPGTLLYS